MRPIDSARPSVASPTSSAAPVRANPAPSREAAPVRVVTFNTAVGNPNIASRGEDFLELPFYQELIHGRPNAPILAGQEIHPSQADALKKAAQNGNFRVIHVDRPPGYKGQGNVLLVPKRFDVLGSGSHYFKGGHGKGVLSAIKGFFKSRDLPDKSALSQIVEPRMWSAVKLKDRESGKVFTVFNTHVSGLGPLRVEQMKELLGHVKEAQKSGPVILAGDLNTGTTQSQRKTQEQYDSVIRGMLAAAGLVDHDAAPGRIEGKSNIDYILSDAFETVSSRHYVGQDLTLPGVGDASAISDHYAEEGVLRFK